MHYLSLEHAAITSYLHTSYLRPVAGLSSHGLMETVWQISNDRKYKPSYMPAVWHEQTAWLCLTVRIRPFTDKLEHLACLPYYPASPSPIRLEAIHPSVQVTPSLRKCPWLKINKRPMCGASAVPTALALVSLACQNRDHFIRCH